MAEEELMMMIHRISCDNEIPDSPKLLKTLKAVNPYDRVKLLKFNDYFGTLLHRLCARGYTDSVKCVIDTVHKRWLMSFLVLSDELGYTALHCAIFCGYDKIVRHILSPISYEDRERLLSIVDKSGNTVLHTAVSYEQVDIIKVTLNLLQPQQRLSLLNVQNSYRMSSLDIGLSSGNDQVKACLIRYKMMSEPPKQQTTCQEFAGHSGESTESILYDCKPEVAQKTLDRLTTCGISEKSVTSARDLMGTAGQSKLSPRASLEDLLNNYRQTKGVIPDITILRKALSSIQSYDCLCLMKSHNSSGTALHCAIAREHTDIALCFVNSLQPNQVFSLLKVYSAKGSSVLHECCSAKAEQVSVIKRLMELMPDLSEKVLILGMKDTRGYTALHCAAKRDFSDTITAILTSVTDVGLRMKLIELKSNGGATALDVAHTHNFEEAAKCIESFKIVGTDRGSEGRDGNNPDTKLEYATLEARMNSFVCWQSSFVISPIIGSLCGAGFYYTGHTDIICCFRCSEGFLNGQ